VTALLKSHLITPIWPLTPNRRRGILDGMKGLFGMGEPLRDARPAIHPLLIVCLLTIAPLWVYAQQDPADRALDLGGSSLPFGASTAAINGRMEPVAHTTESSPILWVAADYSGPSAFLADALAREVLAAPFLDPNLVSMSASLFRRARAPFEESIGSTSTFCGRATALGGMWADASSSSTLRSSERMGRWTPPLHER